MARHRLGATLGAVGLCFLIYYLVVRLLFIQDINVLLAQSKVHSIGDIAANLSGYLIVYLIWVFSFRLGIVLSIIAAALNAGMEARELRWLVIGGVVYLASCYVPIVGYSPPYYGIQGVIILVLFLLVVWHWMKTRPNLSRSGQIASDLRIIGYYFVVVATWSLCGIFGVVTYALKPELMLERGLQPTALMLTSHVMLEFSIGWLFIFLATFRESSVSKG